MAAYPSILASYAERMTSIVDNEVFKPQPFSVAMLPGPIRQAIGRLSHVDRLPSHLNHVLLLSGEHGDIVLKVADRPLRSAQLEYEYDITVALRATSLQPLIPQAVQFARDGGGRAFLLESKLSGEVLTQGALNTQHGVEAVTQLIKKVHAVPVDVVDYQAILEAQLQLAEANLRRGWLDDTEFRGLGQPASVLENLHRHRPKDGQLVLLHGDYRPKNILVVDGVVTGLIDWGFSMVGDSYYDLAMMGWYIKDQHLRDCFQQTCSLGTTIDTAAFDYYGLLAKFLNV